ncbi:MAG: AAA family ATPase [Methanoregula sp.]|jgi:CO dehydrogenase maturation factor|nr:AAA family ATPase [Methanoregula sp.]
MKIAVCGKGGVGKTFIAGSLAEYFSRHGQSVIAIDADSSPNLALSLGLTVGEASRIVPVAENEDLIRLKTRTDYSGVFRLTFTIDDIIEKYAVKTPAGPGLLIMGTVKAMGSGCTCPAHSVIKALMRHLVVDRDEIVILDMEAGIEHLGRGTAEHVDTLIVVSDANRKSRETASSIIRLARESAILDICLVGNRVANPREVEILRSCAEENQVLLAAYIPYDSDVADAGITGDPVRITDSGAPAAIAGLARNLEAANEEKQSKTRGDQR